VPSDSLFKTANVVHRFVQRASFGRLGWRAYRMPVVELTTTGRRSGQPRTVLLTSPRQEGDTLVVVGSRGGDDTHPAWYHNIQADPEVRVKTDGRAARPMRARVASGDERVRLWAQVVESHPHYGGYQEKTEREIPLVLLEPA
jgi:deazaflavin-dependent oxidoreductase (nitroreductase family)